MSKKNEEFKGIFKETVKRLSLALDVTQKDLYKLLTEQPGSNEEPKYMLPTDACEYGDRSCWEYGKRWTPDAKYPKSHSRFSGRLVHHLAGRWPKAGFEPGGTYYNWPESWSYFKYRDLASVERAFEKSKEDADTRRGKEKQDAIDQAIDTGTDIPGWALGKQEVMSDAPNCCPRTFPAGKFKPESYNFFKGLDGKPSPYNQEIFQKISGRGIKRLNPNTGKMHTVSFEDLKERSLFRRVKTQVMSMVQIHKIKREKDPRSRAVGGDPKDPIKIIEKAVPALTSIQDVENFFKAWYALFGKKPELEWSPEEFKETNPDEQGQTRPIDPNTFHAGRETVQSLMKAGRKDDIPEAYRIYSMRLPSGALEKTNTPYLDDATLKMMKAIRLSGQEGIIRTQAGSKYVSPLASTFGNLFRTNYFMKIVEKNPENLLLLNYVYPDLSNAAMDLWFQEFAESRAERWLGASGYFTKSVFPALDHLAPQEEHLGREKNNWFSTTANVSKPTNSWNSDQKQRLASIANQSRSKMGVVIRDESDGEWSTSFHEDPHKEWNVFLWGLREDNKLIKSIVSDKFGSDNIYVRGSAAQSHSAIKRINRAVGGNSGLAATALEFDGKNIIPHAEETFRTQIKFINPFTRGLKSPDQVKETLSYLEAHGFGEKEIEKGQMIGTEYASLESKDDCSSISDETERKECEKKARIAKNHKKLINQVYKSLFLKSVSEKGQITDPEILGLITNYHPEMKIVDINRAFQALPGVTTAYGPCADIFEFISDVTGMRMGPPATEGKWGGPIKLSSCEAAISSAYEAYSSWLKQNKECQNMFPDVGEGDVQYKNLVRKMESITSNMIEELEQANLAIEYTKILQAYEGSEFVNQEIQRLGWYGDPKFNENVTKLWAGLDLKGRDFLKLKTALIETFDDKIFDKLWGEIIKAEKTNPNFKISCLTMPFVTQSWHKDSLLTGLDEELEREFTNLRKRNPILNFIKVAVVQLILIKTIGAVFTLLAWSAKGIWAGLKGVAPRLTQKVTAAKQSASHWATQVQARALGTADASLAVPVGKSLRAQKYLYNLSLRLAQFPLLQAAVLLSRTALHRGPQAIMKYMILFLRPLASMASVRPLPGAPPAWFWLSSVYAFRAMEIDDDIRFFTLGMFLDPLMNPEGYEAWAEQGIQPRKKESMFGATPSLPDVIKVDPDDQKPPKSDKLEKSIKDETSKVTKYKDIDALKSGMRRSSQQTFGVLTQAINDAKKAPTLKAPTQAMSSADAIVDVILLVLIPGADMTFIDVDGEEKKYTWSHWKKDMRDLDLWDSELTELDKKIEKANRSRAKTRDTELRKVKDRSHKGAKKDKKVEESIQRKKTKHLRVKLNN